MEIVIIEKLIEKVVTVSDNSLASLVHVLSLPDSRFGMTSRIKMYMKVYRIMYIPIELQKHILSFLPLKQEILQHKTV